MNTDTAHENGSPLATRSAEPLAGMKAEPIPQSRACSAEPRCPECQPPLLRFLIEPYRIICPVCNGGTGREPAGRAARPNIPVCRADTKTDKL